MNVLIISQYFPPDMGGGSARASNIAFGLQKKGHNVTVISAFPHYPMGLKDKSNLKKSHDRETMNGVTVFRVWIPSLNLNNKKNMLILNTVFCLTALIPLYNGVKYDIIWAANPNIFAFFPALIYSIIGRKKIIRNVDDLWPEIFIDNGVITNPLHISVINFITRISYILPVSITPISPAYVDQIIEKYHINPNKFKVVEVGVDRIPVKENTYKKNVFTIMYSGIFNNQYDFDLVIKTAKKLEDNQHINFVIRGLGRREQHIKDLIKRYSTKNVAFSSDYLEKTELVELLSLADAFILPMRGTRYTEYGLPTKIFEYQSYGKPIICISKGESARYVRETKSGIIVPLGDVEALSETVVRLYEDEALRKKLGENGRKHVEETLTSEKLGERMSKLMHQIMKLK